MIGAAALCAAVTVTVAAQAPRFAFEEATIAQVQAAFRDGSLTCRSLTEQYIRRIESYDKNGPQLNAIVLVNSDALERADDLDRRFKQSGPVGPMHCVPVLVKDNYETIDMPTTAGSLSLKGMMTGKDAFIVKRLRDAGALMIAKSNMAEFAFSPIETVNSILPGYTRNPYDTSRVTAGSSGGSAAGTAANFAMIALASDTGDSIRGPAAHQALVGLRSTMGLVSRGGVVPLNLAADIAGVVTRSVADTAAVLQVIAGEDPNDPATAAGRGHVDANYSASLQRDALKGARIGVLHQAYDMPTADPEVLQIFTRELDVLRREGAIVVDPAAVPEFDAMRRAQSGGCNQFKYDLNNYLKALGDKAPMHSLEEIIKSRRFHPSIQARLEGAQTTDDTPGVTRRLQEPRRVPRQAARGGAERDGHEPARRAGVSDVEQRPAADWRFEYARRRQQSGVRSEHRFPRYHGTDGLYARRNAAGRPPVLRAGMERADAHQARLRIRTGDASSAAAIGRAAATLI